MKTLLHIFCLFFLVFLCSSTSLAQRTRTQKSKPNDEIIWDVARPLTWEDFLGRPTSMSKDNAVPVINLVCKYTSVGDSLFITVQAVFHKKFSWVKKKQLNDNMLSHEQGHFNLYEVYARKVRKDLQKHDKYKMKNAGAYIDKTVAYYTRLLAKEEDTYDNETRHSLNRQMQQIWLSKIDQELSELNDYKSPLIRKVYK